MVLAFGACRSKTIFLVQISHEWWKSGTRRWERLQSAIQFQKEPNPRFPMFWLKQGILGRSESRHGRNRVSFLGALQPSRIELHSYLAEIEGSLKATNIVWLPFTWPQIRHCQEKKGLCNSAQNPFYIESGCWAIWAFLMYLQAYKLIYACIWNFGLVRLTDFDHVCIWRFDPTSWLFSNTWSHQLLPHLVGPDSIPKCFEVTSVASAKAHKLNK